MKKDCGQQWWKDAKFGLFIHWGLYSKLAGEWNGQKVEGIGEWIMKRLSIPVDAYEKIADDFNPVDFDAAQWVAVAKDAGMKYIVITAKHHDGFAMYHSKCSKYNIVDATPFARDPMKELADECRKNDIKLCFYYSQAQDWHEPGGYGYGPIPDEQKDFAGYLEGKCKPQLRELLTQYGDIGLIWFDTPQIMSVEHSLELKRFVKEIQPNCIVSGRIGNALGEYMSTGDNFIPAYPFDGDWEVPATLNDTWGFKTDDLNWKSPRHLIELLLKINNRGGNYLLNVGPDQTGKIPQASVDILKRVGEFVKANGDAIYATKPVWGYPYELDWCYFTSRDNHVYINVTDTAKKAVNIPLFNSKIKSVRLLATGEPLAYTHTFAKASSQYRLNVTMPAALPNDICNTIDVEIEEKAPVFGTLDTL